MDVRSMRWLGVLTLFAIIAISYIDRINLAVLITDPHFLAHFGLAADDRASQGALNTAFMVGYGLSSFVLTPFCATLFGVRRSLLYALVLWGAITFVSPYFASYGTLIGSRILLGVSEGPVFALAATYIKAYFEGKENGKPNSFVNMGTGLGLAIGFPLISTLVGGFDWQSSFFFLGAINILIGIPIVLAFVRMPASHAYQERPKSIGDAVNQVAGLFRQAMHTRYLWLITVLTGAFLAYLWGSTSWLPGYLKTARGFSLREMGWLASLPQYATMLGVLLGGILIDRIERKQVPFIFILGSIGVALSVLLAINVEDKYVATYCLVAANLFWGLQSPAIPSTVQFYSRPEHVPSTYGVVNGTGALVSAFMPLAMGYVIGSAGAAAQGAGFKAGFAMLIGTQFAVLACGALLWSRERAHGEQAQVVIQEVGR